MPEQIHGWGTPPSPADNQNDAGPPVWGWGMPGQSPVSSPDSDLQWIEPLTQNVLLAAQATTRLHTSLDGKFTR